MAKTVIVFLSLFLISLLITFSSVKIATTTLTDGSTPYTFLSHFAYTSPVKQSDGLCTGSNLHDYHKSGWPLQYEYRIPDEPGCGDFNYPLIFVIDLLFYLIVFSITWVGLTILKKHKS